MPKIRYLHKTREGISSIYPKKSGDILQNMNFSRYYRNRGKFIYGFDPNIILNKDIRLKPPAGYRSVEEVYRKIIFRHAQGEHGKK